MPPSQTTIAPVNQSAARQTITEDRESPPFVWGVGIECSFIPHLNVDQFEWTQHDRHWREDFKLIREKLGVAKLRYALPWHQIEPEPGVFDWKLADEKIAALGELGIDTYLDVMHFGTPRWLKQAAGDAEFPDALERFTHALVTRYRGSINTWCPCNEPLVLSLFSGDFGFWPPHHRKWRGYMPVVSRVVQAVSRSIRAIRKVQPEATVLLCDNVENYKSRDASLETEVRRRNLRRFLALDLLMGRIDAKHPLHTWVTAYGLSELDLEWFRLNPQSPDVLGLDYYPHSEWRLERGAGEIRQFRADSPAGLYRIAQSYYSRYGLPMMVTETSIEGKPINREVWLDTIVEDCRRLREEGVPMLGCFWWPAIDQLDWDGALTHRVGKIHEVGLFNLKRESDGTLTRHASPLAAQYAQLAAAGDEAAGAMAPISMPAGEEDQGPPIGVEYSTHTPTTVVELPAAPAKSADGNGHANGNGHTQRLRIPEPAPGLGGEMAALITPAETAAAVNIQSTDRKHTDRYGIVVFSHLRWGFVWQRPQQFLSRFARKHKILFVEEPFFDAPEGAEPRIAYHHVMPKVTVVTPHVPESWHRNPNLPEKLREFTAEAIAAVNDDGEFDAPLLWYYSPMDAAWSLGHFANRGIVYDCMDELSQFTGAPKALVANEARLIEHADVLFTGGYELGEKKSKQHDNVHTFGCGVEFEHFSQAGMPGPVPPDIDFMPRPILGWFGVVDERVDYAMVGEMARKRPDWSFAMVGPVVKVDPNHLPHAPNLFWLGGRDYQQLPGYCRAFDVNMMCFAINAATQYINPTKGLEYMATGKPIVSTPVRDVVRQWTDIVRIASGADEFIAAAEQALAERGNDDRVRRGIELAKQSAWEPTVAKMQGLIRDAITPKDRRSAKPIKPLAEAELQYVYAATQGS
jgi:beta-glucosidase/6-phospho-beta-glucosidase/beta-galactosidase